MQEIEKDLDIWKMKHFFRKSVLICDVGVANISNFLTVLSFVFIHKIKMISNWMHIDHESQVQQQQCLTWAKNFLFFKLTKLLVKNSKKM